MAIIRIQDLKVRALIGAYPHERVNKQELSIHITLEYDATRACVSDKLQDALNYDSLAKALIKIVERSHFTLLEKLAAKLLAHVMADRRVAKAFVRIDKPQAVAEAQCVSFELEAQRLKK